MSIFLNQCQCIQRRQEHDVPERELAEVPPFHRAVGRCVEPVRDQAGHGGDERPQPAQVHAHQQAGAVRRELRQQQRGRHVRNDLRRQNAGLHFSAAHGVLEEFPHVRQAPDVADEHEEKHEREEQGIVHHAEQPVVLEDHDGQHRDEQHPPVQHPCYGQQTQQEQCRVHEERLPVERVEGAALRQRSSPAGYQHQGQHNEQHQGQRRVRRHGAEEHAEGQVILAVKVQVLRVADRRQHTAEVRGQGLQHQRVHERFLAPCHLSEHEQGEGNKGDQRHIVGQKHTEPEAQQHEQQRDDPHGAHLPQKELGQHAERARGPKPRHDGHQGKQKSQHPPVHIRDVRAGGRHQKARHQRQHSRHHEHGLRPQELDQRLHSAPLLSKTFPIIPHRQFCGDIPFDR